MTRRFDPRRAKAHRTYDCAEIADLYHVTIFTAHRWCREGLRRIDNCRPYIVAGAELADFIRRRNKPYEPLAPGEIYCLGCKRPCVPAGNRATLVHVAENRWELWGRCAESGHRVLVRVRLDRLREKVGALDVRYEDGSVALSEGCFVPRSDSFKGSGG